LEVLLKIMVKKFYLIIYLFSGFVLNSCEDDPLLGPQISDCAPGDSYCEISLPGDEDDTKIKNPETF